MFGRMSLSHQTCFVVRSTVAAIICLAVISGFVCYVGISSVATFQKQLDTAINQGMPLIQGINNIKLDVVQTQQFLTDISATRGLDGLDDGLKEAAGFAQKIKEDLKVAATHAQALGLTDIVKELDDTKSDYTTFYEVGQKMAHAYVDGGPASGNKIMESFDATSEELGRHLDKIILSVEKFQKDEAESAARSGTIASRNIYAGSFFCGLFVFFGFIIASNTRKWLYALIKDLNTVIAVASSISTGDLNNRITGIKRQDELGTLQKKINYMIDLVEVFSKEAEAAMKSAMVRHYYRTVIPTGLPGYFGRVAKHIGASFNEMRRRDTEVSSFVDKNVRSIADMVATNASELDQGVEVISKFSNETRKRAGVASDAATQTQQNMQTVAAAIEELTASVGEISSQMNRTAAEAQESVTAVEGTDKVVADLSDAVGRIGTIAELINDITNQTNLLALNATIEAARAGEAGKGFAVVASEVKNLANQTSHSTGEIAHQISAVQRAAQEVGKAMSNIKDRVRSIGHAATAVASAVEEQQAVARSISESVNDVTRTAGEVTQVMEVLTTTAAESADVVTNIKSSSSRVSGEAGNLRGEISGFLTKISAVG